MFNKMFSITARLRDFVESRKRPQRYVTKQLLQVSLSVPKKVTSGPLPPIYALKLTLPGHTYDVSVNGLAMILPAVHLGGFYFTDGERTLRVTLSLDTAVVEMEVLPMRYEQVANQEGYFVGAKIVSIKDANRAVFADFLQSLGAPLRQAPREKSLMGKMTSKTVSFGFINRVG